MLFGPVRLHAKPKAMKPASAARWRAVSCCCLSSPLLRPVITLPCAAFSADPHTGPDQSWESGKALFRVSAWNCAKRAVKFQTVLLSLSAAATGGNLGVYRNTISRLPSRPIASLNTPAAPEAHDLRPPRATTHPRFLSHHHFCVRNARGACSVFTLWPDFTAGSRAVERDRKSPCQSGRGRTADRRIARAGASQAGTAPANHSGVRGGERTRAATQSAQLPHHRGGFPWLRLAQVQVPAKPGSP